MLFCSERAMRPSLNQPPEGFSVSKVTSKLTSKVSSGILERPLCCYYSLVFQDMGCKSPNLGCFRSSLQSRQGAFLPRLEMQGMPAFPNAAVSEGAKAVWLPWACLWHVSKCMDNQTAEQADELEKALMWSSGACTCACTGG